MAKWRLVQNGRTGAPRALVVVYHAASVIDERLKIICGLDATIVNYSATPMEGNYAQVGKNGLQSLPDLYDEVKAKVLAPDFAPVVFCGFSEGCQAVRAQLRAGYAPHGIVACDGTHSSKPIPKEGSAGYAYEIQPWRDWLDQAKWGDNPKYAAVFTSTEIEPGTYTSTRDTLEYIFKIDDIASGTGPDAPAVVGNVGVQIWGYPGKTADDHSNQLLRALPRAIGEVLADFDVIKRGGPEVLALEEYLHNRPPKGDPQKPPVLHLPKNPVPVPVPIPIRKPSVAKGNVTPLVVGGLAFAGLCGLAYALEKKAKRA